MWKDIHYTIFPFLEAALRKHPMVIDFKKIETEDYFLYEITRNWKRDLTIWVCDSYIFTEKDYFNKPTNIDFIYIAKPEASYSEWFVDLLKQDWMNIWKLWALMGILYVDNITDYIPVERRERGE